MLFGRGDADARERRRRDRTWRCSARRRSICSPSAPIAFTSATARHEYHVVADRTRPLDFEIYEVTSVVGHGDRHRQRAAVSAVLLGLQQRSGASAVRRTSRRAASRGWSRRPRSAAAPARATSAARSSCRLSIRRRRRSAATCASSSIQTLCTNRDLVLQMPIGIGNERSVRWTSRLR